MYVDMITDIYLCRYKYLTIKGIEKYLITIEISTGKITSLLSVRNSLFFNSTPH